MYIHVVQGVQVGMQVGTVKIVPSNNEKNI